MAKDTPRNEREGSLADWLGLLIRDVVSGASAWTSTKPSFLKGKEKPDPHKFGSFARLSYDSEALAQLPVGTVRSILTTYLGRRGLEDLKNMDPARIQKIAELITMLETDGCAAESFRLSLAVSGQPSTPQGRLPHPFPYLISAVNDELLKTELEELIRLFLEDLRAAGERWDALAGVDPDDLLASVRTLLPTGSSATSSPRQTREWIEDMVGTRAMGGLMGADPQTISEMATSVGRDLLMFRSTEEYYDPSGLPHEPPESLPKLAAALTNELFVRQGETSLQEPLRAIIGQVAQGSEHWSLGEFGTRDVFLHVRELTEELEAPEAPSPVQTRGRMVAELTEGAVQRLTALSDEEIKSVAVLAMISWRDRVEAEMHPGSYRPTFTDPASPKPLVLNALFRKIRYLPSSSS